MTLRLFLNRGGARTDRDYLHMELYGDMLYLIPSDLGAVTLRKEKNETGRKSGANNRSG